MSALIGFREWRISHNNLTSLYDPMIWEPGINQAECAATDHPETPAPHGAGGSHCGFNAWYSMDLAYDCYHQTLGAIAGAGQIYMHDLGFRSEQAQILALYADPYRRVEEHSIHRIAETLGIPVFDSKEEMLEFVKPLGIYVPDVSLDENNREWYDSVFPKDSVDDRPSRILEDGTQEWYQKGALHRENGPAVISADKEVWYRNGEIHRNDGPAYSGEFRRGWYQNGVLHREDDLPALIDRSGKHWYHNGLLHRENDQPASVTDNGEEWYRNGRLHRENDQPAVILKEPDMRFYGETSELILTEAREIMEWRKESKFYREGGKPAKVVFVDSLSEVYRGLDTTYEGRPALLYFYDSKGCLIRDYRDETNTF